MVEAQEVKTPRHRSITTAWTRCHGRLESNQLGLVGMKLKTKTPKAFGKSHEDTLSVSSLPENHHQVIGIANHFGTPSHARAHFLVPPCIDDLMQVNIRQQWRYYPSLRRARLGMSYDTLVQHSSTEPFSDEPNHDPIDYPLTKNAS